MEKTKSVGLHGYRIMSAYTGTRRTSATISRVIYLNHFINLIFLNVIVNNIVSTNITIGAIH